MLGGTFFEEFYGVFTNKYTSTTEVQQSALIYMQQASPYNSYIGNQVLPVGPDPFAPPIPTSTSLTWLWVLLGVILGCVLIAAGFYFFYQHKRKQS